MLALLLSEVRQQAEQSDPPVKAAALLHLARVLTAFDQPITKMAQRSNRRFLNLISVAAHQGHIANREKAGGIHHGQGSQIPTKAEYICADQTAISSFRLQIRGGPYIAILSNNAPRRAFHHRVGPPSSIWPPNNVRPSASVTDLAAASFEPSFAR